VREVYESEDSINHRVTDRYQRVDATE